VVNLTLNPSNDYASVLSLDGKIAFTSERDGNPEIYIMNSDGTGQTNVTNSTASDGYPSFAPDGAWIAFNSNRDGDVEVWITRINGTDVYNFTSSPATDFLYLAVAPGRVRHGTSSRHAPLCARQFAALKVILRWVRAQRRILAHSAAWQSSPPCGDLRPWLCRQLSLVAFRRRSLVIFPKKV
jgi:hypothetical protein